MIDFAGLFTASFLVGFGVSTFAALIGMAIRYAKKIFTISADAGEF